MTSKQSLAVCVYCGNEKMTTDDHVISRGLFPASHIKIKPIIVPSCLDCNRGFSHDEEDFRNYICNIASEHSDTANEIFNTTMKRSIQRGPIIGFRMLERMETIFMGGKDQPLEEMVRIKTTPDDWKRICNVLDKYIRGLHYHEFNEIFPNIYRIHHSYGNDRLEENLKHIQLRNVDNRTIVAYGFSRLENTTQAIWAIVFYGYVLFMSVIGNKENFAKFSYK